MTKKSNRLEEAATAHEGTPQAVDKVPVEAHAAQVTPAVVVARFSTYKDAEHALASVGDMLSLTGARVHQGALVSRSLAGEVLIHDLRDTSARDLASGAANLTLFLSVGAARIAMSTLKTCTRLLWNSADRFADLAVTAARLPFVKLQLAFEPNERAQKLAEDLAPGASAVVVVADAKDLQALHDTLAAAGGQIV